MKIFSILISIFLFIVTPVSAQIQEWDPAGSGNSGCLVDNVPTLKCFEVVFNNILFMSSALVVVVLFVMFLIGGFNYLTSFGNPEKVKKAQGTLKWALLGFVIFLSAFLILNIIDILFLGGQGNIFKLNIGS